MNITTQSISNVIENLSITTGLWFSLDTMNDDIPELMTGDLVEWTRYDDEGEIGIGIIKNFSNQRFLDYDTGNYVDLQCAYVENANPADPYGYYIPLTHLDFITLSEYISIHKDAYETNLQDLQILRRAVTSKMQTHGWERGQGNLSKLLHVTESIQSTKQ